MSSAGLVYFLSSGLRRPAFLAAHRSTATSGIYSPRSTPRTRRNDHLSVLRALGGEAPSRRPGRAQARWRRSGDCESRWFGFRLIHRLSTPSSRASRSAVSSGEEEAGDRLGVLRALAVKTPSRIQAELSLEAATQRFRKREESALCGSIDCPHLLCAFALNPFPSQPDL